MTDDDFATGYANMRHHLLRHPEDEDTHRVFGDFLKDHAAGSTMDDPHYALGQLHHDTALLLRRKDSGAADYAARALEELGPVGEPHVALARSELHDWRNANQHQEGFSMAI